MSITHLLLVCGISLNAQSNFLQSSLLQNLLSHITIFNVLKEPVHGSAIDS